MTISNFSYFKRFLICLIALALIASLPLPVRAASSSDFTDIDGHWAADALEWAIDNSVMNGTSATTMTPNGLLERAQMGTMLDRLYGTYNAADISAYTDVALESWYYDYIAQAVQMGTLTGYSATRMAPEDNITREQAIVVVARAICLTAPSEDVLTQFGDASEVSDWAYDQVGAMVERGYVNGYPNGNLGPQDVISRAEMAQILARIFTVISDGGELTGEYSGVVLVRGDVDIHDAVFEDLILANGLGESDLDIDNVTVSGRLVIWGGSDISVTGTSSVNEVIVARTDGDVKFSFDDEAESRNADVTVTTNGGTDCGSDGPWYFITGGELTGDYDGTVVITDTVKVIDATINGDIIIAADTDNGSVTISDTTIGGDLIIDAEAVVNVTGNTTAEEIIVTKDDGEITINFDEEAAEANKTTNITLADGSECDVTVNKDETESGGTGGIIVRNPSVSFTLMAFGYCGDEITVSTTFSDVDSVTWSLTKDGENIDVSGLDKDGGTLIFTEAGTYTLTATAAAGSYTATYEQSIIVLEAEEKDNTILFTGAGEVTVSKAAPYISLENPSENNVDFVFVVKDKTSGDTIAQAKKVAPGTSAVVDVVSYYSTAGRYELTIEIIPYSSDGSASNGMTAEMVVVVVE